MPLHLNRSTSPTRAFAAIWRISLITALVALLNACAGINQPDPSEYIDAGDYDRLKQVAVQPGIRIFRYLSPDFKRSNFKTVMVDPIVLYQPAEKNLGKTDLSDETIYRIRNSMDIAMRQLVRKQFGISYKPGPTVARLSTAITGVLLDGETFKPRRLVPVSTVLKAAGKGNNINGSKPYLMVETKLISSTTGSLIGEGIYVISSEQFRQEVDSPEKFQQLAGSWVRGAVSVAAGLR